MTDQENTADPGTTGELIEERFALLFERTNGLASDISALTKRIDDERDATTHGLNCAATNIQRGLQIITNRANAVAAAVTALNERFDSVEIQSRYTRSGFSTLSGRIAALESACVTPAEARESDKPMCECGHRHSRRGICRDLDCRCEHFRPAAPPAPAELDVDLCSRCQHMRGHHEVGVDGGCSLMYCNCLGFIDGRPAPEPAPTVALDPVLEAICDLYRELCSIDPDAEVLDIVKTAYRKESGTTYGGVHETMLEYGARS